MLPNKALCCDGNTPKQSLKLNQSKGNGYNGLKVGAKKQGTVLWRRHSTRHTYEAGENLIAETLKTKVGSLAVKIISPQVS